MRSRILATLTLLGLVGSLFAQAQPGQAAPPTGTLRTPEEQARYDFEMERLRSLAQAEDQAREAERQRLLLGEAEGVSVRIKDIARFRGVRDNQLHGYGLVVGLEGTGDSQSTPFTANLLSNALRRWGAMVDPARFQPKNIATVAVIATLPPFASPGNRIDVQVQSIGDAESLQGGTLLLTPLFGPTDEKTVIAVAQGSISIGGFNVQAGGSRVQRNHTNVGRIPGGAIVETGVQTQVVFSDNTLYLELDESDLTTVNRMATRLAESFPQFTVKAEDGGTISVRFPEGMSPMMAMSQIESTSVVADVPAVVVVNERTGTIVVGGNVRLGPAVIAHGGLQVRIAAITEVSQPQPFTQGTTEVVTQTVVEAEEDFAQVGVIAPNPTLSDLAVILQTLKVTPRDIIAILQALREQGSLKARIRLQ